MQMWFAGVDRQDAYLSRTFPSKSKLDDLKIVQCIYARLWMYTLITESESIKDIPLYGEMHRFIPIYVTWRVLDR